MTTNQDNTTSTTTDPTAVKDPENWVTGDEDMTGAQRSYLETLTRETGGDLPIDEMSKAEASQRIDKLQDETGRGVD